MFSSLLSSISFYTLCCINRKLYEIKPPFNVSRPALFAATQAIQDTNWLNKAIKHNKYWCEKIFDVIDEVGIATNKTNVNLSHFLRSHSALRFFKMLN